VRSLRPLANFDISAARTKLGWEPRVGLRRGLDTMFATAPVAAATVPQGTEP
jgi:2-alkyl-3-oxoalkanoate reductase